jgi:hypothetical protein
LEAIFINYFLAKLQTPQSQKLTIDPKWYKKPYLHKTIIGFSGQSKTTNQIENQHCSNSFEVFAFKNQIKLLI